jgi:uncharacterized membrane protein
MAREKNEVAGEEQTQSSSESRAAQAEKNIESIMKLEQEAVHSRSPAEHVADKITSFAGSTPFLIFHIIWFSVWVMMNVGLIPRIHPFDPFPFSFLTLVVSLEAIFLTLLVLMSQNRMMKEADKRTHLDLQLNMLAEQESTVLLKLVQRIAEHLGIEEHSDQTARELAEDTDVHRLAKSLDEKLPG